MDSGNADRSSPGIQGAIAGFQAGMVAVLAMLAWLGFASLFYRRTFWMAPNLIATLFYGDDAVRPGFAFSTLAGIALYLIAYSLLGAAFGWAAQRQSRRRHLLLGGVALALAWYYLWWGLLWRHLDVLIPLYTHDRPMAVGHVLYGLALAAFRRYLPQAAPPPAPPVEIPAQPEVGAEEARPQQP
jgi:hypothetical protein